MYRRRKEEKAHEISLVGAFIVRLPTEECVNGSSSSNEEVADFTCSVQRCRSDCTVRCFVLLSVNSYFSVDTNSKNNNKN